MQPIKIGTHTWRARQCGYAPPGVPATDENACGRDAIVHVAWERIPTPMTFICELHVSEVLSNFRHQAFHSLTPDCGMPGAVYFENENTCRCTEELENLKVAETQKEVRA